MAKADLTAARLRSLLCYDPETGVFTHRITSGRRRCVAGTVASRDSQTGRLIVSIDRHNHYAHRAAWLYMTGAFPVGVIDHLDGDSFNNRFANLRDVPQAINQQNLRAAHIDSSSGYLGVSANKRRWAASIKVLGVRKHLGTYDTAEEAYAVYLEAKRRLHVGCTI
jgi:hypothetical protein